MHYRDLLRTANLPSPATTVDDTVKTSLKPAKELLRTITHYCVFEGLS